MTVSDAVAHLTPALWEQANRLLVRKALAEFSHERLLTPEPLGQDSYRVLSDDSASEYRFTARRFALDHWQVFADSLTCHRDGEPQPVDALEFFIGLRSSLGLSEEILPVYLEEISSTLSGTAYKLTKKPVTSAALARAGFQAIETGMTEGHPCFVANNGRLGFGVHEYRSYAPETAGAVRLIWLAARRDVATFTCGAGLDYASLVREELGEGALARFGAQLNDLGLDLADYFCCPSTPGSGGTSSPSPSPPRSPNSVWCAWARGTTTIWRSSRSVRSSTRAPPRSTTSKPPCPSSTWALCAVFQPRTWRRPRRSTTGSRV